VSPSPIWITVDEKATLEGVTDFLAEAEPYGVLLFARHLKDESQVRELNACIHGAVRGWTPRIALDQEGGRVNRLGALGMNFPSAADMGGRPELTEALAFEMGEQLKDLGFDVDFAPVADLGPAHEGTGLEGRVYGEDPDTVARCCRAFLLGLTRAGVAGCLKHFPGLGGSRVDSHRSLPAMAGDAEERRAHLAPYAELKDLSPYVMIAHGAYEGLLGTAEPSSLEPATYALLRNLGFSGLSVTDDLGMGAVSGLASIADLAERSLGAGASLALWVSSQERSLEAMEQLARSVPFVERKAALPYG
jgi:beta-N-acetylhexosaminidase